MALIPQGINILRTKNALPSTSLNTGPFVGMNGAQMVEASRQLNPQEVREVFGDQTIATIRGSNYLIQTIRRFAFDGLIKWDHMLVAEPKSSETPVPWDFQQLIEYNPEACNDLLKGTVATLRSYLAGGADKAMEVLNTSAYDVGYYIDQFGFEQAKKLSQSLELVHIKVFGFKSSKLEESNPSEEELKLINRPMQEQMNNLIKLASKKFGVENPERNDLPSVGIRIEKYEDFLNIYTQVHEFMTKVAGYTVNSQEFSEQIPFTKSTKSPYVHGVNVLNPVRVSRRDAVKNLLHNSERILDESGIDTPDFGENLEYDKEYESEARRMMVDYMLETASYIQKTENCIIPYGPQFTVYFELDSDGKLCAFFCPADYIPKGGNTISKIIPKESKRDFTKEEKYQLIEGDNVVMKYLAKMFGPKKFRPNLFNYHKYFSKFKK